MSQHRQTKQVRHYAQLMELVRNNGGVECEQLPDVFFPEDGVNIAEVRQMNQLAKEVCDRCPIKVQCGEYGVLNQEPFGIWGGLTLADRERLRKK